MYGPAKIVDGTTKLCEVGDIFYRVGSTNTDEITKITIIEIKCYGHYVYKDDKKHSYFNRTLLASCFKTEAEARLELQKRRAITEKKKRLKEYERLLNEKLNLKDHFIIK